MKSGRSCTPAHKSKTAILLSTKGPMHSEKKENSRAPWFGRQRGNYHTTQVPRAFSTPPHSEGSCRGASQEGPLHARAKFGVAGGRTLPNPNPSPPRLRRSPLTCWNASCRAALPAVPRFVNPLFAHPPPRPRLRVCRSCFFRSLFRKFSRKFLGVGCRGGEKVPRGAGAGAGEVDRCRSIGEEPCSKDRPDHNPARDLSVADAPASDRKEAAREQKGHDDTALDSAWLGAILRGRADGAGFTQTQCVRPSVRVSEQPWHFRLSRRLLVVLQ